MKVSPNIGIINALIRITFGLTMVAFYIAKLSRKPWCNSYLWMILIGAMKVGEGIVRYCPITALFQKGQGMMGNGNMPQNQNAQTEKKAENKPKDPPPNIPPELADSIKSVLE